MRQTHNDSQHLVDLIQAQGAETVIPPRANRTIQRVYDSEIYKQRNWIERAFNRLKYYRRIVPHATTEKPYTTLLSSIWPLLSAGGDSP